MTTEIEKADDCLYLLARSLADLVESVKNGRCVNAGAVHSSSNRRSSHIVVTARVR